ncbi:MAG: NAD(P)H-dependent oxidoreductase subunit E [Bacillota bacterium]
MERCTGLTLSDPRFAELKGSIDRHRTGGTAVIYALERARYLFGALPLPVLHFIADNLQLPRGDVYQAVSFYDFFATRPPGQHTVTICLGTHCYMSGSNALFDRLRAELGIGPGETTPDGLFTLTVSYSGEWCGEEPGFWIDEERFAAKPEEVPAILNSFRPEPVTVGASPD